MSWTTARLQAAGVAAATTSSHVAWSENGTDEAHAKVARTALTGTNGIVVTDANPSVASNEEALESAGAAAGGAAITHFAFCMSDTGGASDLTTTWNALDDTVNLLEGGKITVAIGALKENIHQTTSAPS